MLAFCCLAFCSRVGIGRWQNSQQGKCNPMLDTQEVSGEAGCCARWMAVPGTKIFFIAVGGKSSNHAAHGTGISSWLFQRDNWMLCRHLSGTAMYCLNRVCLRKGNETIDRQSQWPSSTSSGSKCGGFVLLVSPEFGDYLTAVNYYSGLFIVNRNSWRSELLLSQTFPVLTANEQHWLLVPCIFPNSWAPMPDFYHLDQWLHSLP